jgi:hypothetical protein
MRTRPFRARLGTALAALCGALALLSGLQTAHALDAHGLAENMARTAVHASELGYLRNTQQITPQDYQEQIRRNSEDAARWMQQLRQLPADQQVAVRREVSALFNQGIQQLRQRAQQAQQARLAQQRAALQAQQEARRAELAEKRAQQQAEAVRAKQAAEAQRRAQAAQAQQAAEAQRQAQAAQAQQTAAQGEQGAGGQAQPVTRGVPAQTGAPPLPPRPRSATSVGAEALPPPPPRPTLADPGNVDLSPPPPGSSSFRRFGSTGNTVGYAWTLLLIPVAGLGYFVFGRRRRKAKPALPSELDSIPLVSSAEAARHAAATTMAQATVATPKVTVAAAKVTVAPSAQPAAASRTSVSQPSTPAARAAGAVAGSASVKPGAVKARLLNEQTAKYQASLTNAMDELTATQMQVQERSQTPELIRKDLQRVGSEICVTAKQLMRARHGSGATTIVKALLLMPVWRIFRRGGLLVKIVIGIAVYSLGSSLLGWLAQGMLLRVILVGGIVVGICYFLERRSRLQGPAALMAESAAAISHPALVHFHPEQPPVNPLWSVRVKSEPVGPTWDTPQANLTNVDLATVPGSFNLLFANLATYRVAVGPAPQEVWCGTSALMTAYKGVLADALVQHNGELAPLIKHLEQFGDLVARERRQREQIPRLEELLRNVSRLEEIWRGVYAADKVFEFLMRRIDLFNLRDKAAPAGLLLYGYPGNGKEFLARKIAQSVFAQFVKPNADQLATPKDIKELWSANLGKGPVVLFIEYADHLFPKPGS